MNLFLAFPENLLGNLIMRTIHLLPGVDVVACFSIAGDYLSSHRLSDFDIALIYVESGQHSSCGFNLLRRFRERAPHTKCVLVFEKVTREPVTRAFCLGARGVLGAETCDSDQLCRCIIQIHAGQVWADNMQVRWLIEELSSSRLGNSRRYRASSRFDNVPLSRRESEVVRLVARGNTNREIASALNLSEATVKNYLSRVFEKMGVSSRIELISRPAMEIIDEPVTRNRSFSRKSILSPLFFRRLASGTDRSREGDCAGHKS